jgi:hypothetical protein
MGVIGVNQKSRNETTLMNLFLILILFFSVANSHKSLELRSLKYSSVDKTFSEFQDYGLQGVHKKTNSDSLKVSYFNDTIRIFANNKLIKFKRIIHSY